MVIHIRLSSKANANSPRFTPAELRRGVLEGGGKLQMGGGGKNPKDRSLFHPYTPHAEIFFLLQSFFWRVAMWENDVQYNSRKPRAVRRNFLFFSVGYAAETRNPPIFEAFNNFSPEWIDFQGNIFHPAKQGSPRLICLGWQSRALNWPICKKPERAYKN